MTRRAYGSLSSRRADGKRITRRKIIDACCLLLLDEAAEPLTVERVAETAGVSRATYYLHFRSVDELTAELRATMMANFDGCYDALATLEQPSLLDVKSWLSELLAMCWEERPLLLALMQAGNSPTSAFDPRLYYGGVIGRLGIGHLAFARADAGESEPRARALLLLMQIESLIRYCVAAEGPCPDEDALVSEVANNLNAFIGSGERPPAPVLIVPALPSSDGN